MLGPQGLNNIELIALFIQSGTKSSSAVDLARQVFLAGGNNWAQLSKLSMEDLLQIKGIGEAKAMSLIALFEMARRRQLEAVPGPQAMRNSQDMGNFFITMLQDYRHEVFGIAYLNRANRINHFELISQGGLSATVVDTRIVLRKALQYDTACLVICHNHPSGNLTPSTADDEVTYKLKNAAQLFDIKLLDHFIVGQGGYFSYAENDRLH